MSAESKRSAWPRSDVRVKRPLKLVTFDLDDTVWHCAPILERARARMFTRLESEYPLITEELFFEMRDQTDFRLPEISYDFSKMMRVILRKCCARTGYDPEVVVEPMFQEYYTNRNKVDDHLFPGALSTIDNVRSRSRSPRLQVGAISNGNSNVDLIDSLSARFDFRVNPEVCGHSKHSPEPFEFAKNSAKIDFSVHSGVHIGDNYREDVVVAKSAGFFTVWIDNRALLHELNEKLALSVNGLPKTAPGEKAQKSSAENNPTTSSKSSEDETHVPLAAAKDETHASHSAAEEREKALGIPKPVFTDENPCEADLVIRSISEWETLATFLDTFSAENSRSRDES